MSLFFKIFISLLFSSYCFAEQSSDYQKMYKIEKYEVSNAKWSVLSDGTFPRLLSYDIKLILEGGHLFKGTITDHIYGEISDPYEFLKTSDLIEILREGYFFNKPEESFFTIKNIRTKKTFEVCGNSIKPKIQIDANDSIHLISNVIIESKNAQEHIVKFFIKNWEIAIPVESEKYHGYYEGMPILINNVEKNLEDEFGWYYYNLDIQNIDSGESFSVHSQSFNEMKTGLIQNIEMLNYQPPIGDVSDRYYFTIRLTLIDGSFYEHAYSLRYHWDKFFLYTGIMYDKREIMNILNQSVQIGDEVIILIEEPMSVHRRNRSRFLLLLPRIGHEEYFDGTCRAENP